MSLFVLEDGEAVDGGLADRVHRPTFRPALNEHALTPRLIGGKIDFMIQIYFTDPESKRGALARLAGATPSRVGRPARCWSRKLPWGILPSKAFRSTSRDRRPMS